MVFDNIYLKLERRSERPTLFLFIFQKRGVWNKSMKNIKLRMIWVIPQIFLAIINILLLGFIIVKWSYLGNSKPLYISICVLLFLVIVLGVYKIIDWINKGKM